jgi:hypothetical protein
MRCQKGYVIFPEPPCDKWIGLRVTHSRPVSNVKAGAVMEHITMIAATLISDRGVHAELSRLWIGQEEIPVEGRSISQWLEEMQGQGWMLTTARAKPNGHGTLCEYEFQRPNAVAAR